MLGALLSLTLAATIPSPGRAVLDATFRVAGAAGPVEASLRLAAAADAEDDTGGAASGASAEPEGVKDLEQDMEDARRHIKHAGKPGAKEKGKQAERDRSEAATASERAADDSASSVGQDDEDDDDDDEDAEEAAEHQRREEHRRLHKRAKKLARQVTQPSIEGHGKGYYLTWGLIDWALAGGAWGASMGTGVWGAVAASFAASEEGRAHLDREERRAVYTAAAVAGAASIGLGALGGLFGSRAGHNIHNYREIKAQQRALIEAIEEREGGSVAPDAADRTETVED